MGNGAGRTQSGRGKNVSAPDVHVIAEELRGTSKSLDDVLEELGSSYDAMTREWFYDLDQVVFQCEGCNWWCEISEMTEDPDFDWHCRDCRPDKEEE